MTRVPFPGELLIWLSPSFPIGSFAYSQGLEAAVDRGWVEDAEALQDWLVALIRHGAARNDLVIIALIMRADHPSGLLDLIELSTALQPSAERAKEALDQGRSFIAAYKAGWSPSDADCEAFADIGNVTFPAALAVAARAETLALNATLEAYAIAICSNLLSAAIRLSVIGQFQAQRMLADLLPVIRETGQSAEHATVDDLGSSTYGADLASMHHETQVTRLFRS